MVRGRLLKISIFPVAPRLLVRGNINSWCVCNGQIYDIFVSIKLSAEIGLKCNKHFEPVLVCCGFFLTVR